MGGTDGGWEFKMALKMLRERMMIRPYVGNNAYAGLSGACSGVFALWRSLREKLLSETF